METTAMILNDLINSETTLQSPLHPAGVGVRAALPLRVRLPSPPQHKHVVFIDVSFIAFSVCVHPALPACPSPLLSAEVQRPLRAARTILPFLRSHGAVHIAPLQRVPS